MKFESNAELVFWERCIRAILRCGANYNRTPAEVADDLVKERRKRIPEYAQQRERWPDHWRESPPETT